jgi:hypothetical protein
MNKQTRLADLSLDNFTEFCSDYWNANKSITFKQFCDGLKDYQAVTQ